MKKLYIIHTDKDYHALNNEHIIIVAADNESDAIDVAINTLGINFCDWDDLIIHKIKNSRSSKVQLLLY
jgi:hypothetical protein